MYTKQEIIIRYLREGKSQREISRVLQISRKTVKKYIEGYFSSQKEAGKGEENLHEDLSKRPKYNCPKRPKRALTEEISAQIDQLLEDNARKRRSGLHKQVLKKCDILMVLHQKGYRIGYTTVCNYISGKERRSSEAFIRQRYKPGSVCEFDWGEVKIHIQGKRTVLQMAVFTSGYSNYRYACLFYRQDTLAFMESHVKFFAHTGGVYHQMVYDNMRVAVARFVGRNEKSLLRR
jgi:transposase